MARRNGAQDVVAGDLRDQVSVRQTTDGVDGVSISAGKRFRGHTADTIWTQLQLTRLNYIGVLLQLDTVLPP